MKQIHDDNEIKISVVIPVYNCAETIEQAIDSVLAQSYQPHEIIVVDDASQDNTPEIIQVKYAGRIHFIEKLTNQGNSVACNKGMDAATGDYIAFLDANDIWHKDKLALLKTILAAQPGIRLFYHAFTQYQLKDKQLPGNIVVYKLPFVKMLSGNIITTSCIVVKNNPAFRFEPDMRYLAGFDLCLRIGYKYKIYFIKIPLVQISGPSNAVGKTGAIKWKICKEAINAHTRLIKLNPLFISLIPFLLLSSLIKTLTSKWEPPM